MINEVILCGFWVAGIAIGIALERRFNFYKW